MIKLESHAHLIGSSHCAKCPLQDMIKVYKENGFNAVVFTNHISQHAKSTNFNCETDKEYVKKWLEIVYNAQEEFKKEGIKTFFGAEIAANEKTTMEFSLIGFDEKFLYDNLCLYKLSQKELFALAEKNNLFMYQTHPFRDGVTCGDPKFLHGAEAFNAHHHHNSHNELALEFCKKNSLVKLVGNDYHDLGQPLHTAMYIPDNIQTNEELRDYYFKGKAKLYYDEEGYKHSLQKYLETKKEICK